MSANSGGYDRIWRFVRIRRGWWTIRFCASMVHCEYSHVRKYVNELERLGLVERKQVKGRSYVFRGTKEAQKTPETPIAKKQVYIRKGENTMSTSIRKVWGCTLTLYNYGTRSAKIEVVKEGNRICTLTAKDLENTKIAEQDMAGFLRVISVFDVAYETDNTSVENIT